MSVNINILVMQSLVFFESRLYYLTLFFLFFSCAFGFSQSKSMSGVIEHNYSNYSSPIEIVYTAHVDHGSGDYEYSWNIRGNKWSDFSDSKNWKLIFRCHPNKRPEQKVYCKIRDKKSGELLIITDLHVVEPCNSEKR